MTSCWVTGAGGRTDFPLHNLLLGGFSLGGEERRVGIAISGTGEGESGSLLELTTGGTTPLALPNGETRRFQQDGDEVSLVARAVALGIGSIGSGSCSGVILPAIGSGY